MPMDLGRDLNKALCKIHPFFYPNFLDSERGTRLKESLLFKQEERSKSPPDVRTHISNKYRSKEFWANLDSETKKMKDKDDLEALPEEWDVTVRPIIAHRKQFQLSINIFTPDIMVHSLQIRRSSNPSRHLALRTSLRCCGIPPSDIRSLHRLPQPEERDPSGHVDSSLHPRLQTHRFRVHRQEPQSPLLNSPPLVSGLLLPPHDRPRQPRSDLLP